MFDKLIEVVENRELTCFSDPKSKHYLLAIMQEKGLSVERADEIAVNFLKQCKSKQKNALRKRIVGSCKALCLASGDCPYSS